MYKRQGWRWVVIDDADTRLALAELYRKGAKDYLEMGAMAAKQKGDGQTTRVLDSATWLAENLEKVPVYVIPCVQGRPTPGMHPGIVSGLYGSIFPAVWSFQLALRSRGLGSTITTLHLSFEQEVAQLLGIPDDVMQVALLPVGYTKGCLLYTSPSPRD